MNKERGEEFVAYSVQDLGGLWRWRVYRAGGQVIRDGVAATEDGAERAAAALVFGFASRPPARPAGPARLAASREAAGQAGLLSAGR